MKSLFSARWIALIGAIGVGVALSSCAANVEPSQSSSGGGTGAIDSGMDTATGIGTGGAPGTSSGGTGVVNPGTGGTGTGGTGRGSGGATAPGTGGSNTGGRAAGGTGTGGRGTGGTGTGGIATGGAGGSSLTEMARVAAWLNNTLAVNALPGYAYANIRTNFGTPAQFNRLVTAIVNACAAFAPPGGDWLVMCEALITSAMVAESSYNPLLIVADAYGGAADPTVGLLQNRFSSTVHDYNFFGPLDKMATIGCTWPTNLPTSMTAPEWRTLGGTATGLNLMQDPACSVGLASWYYLYNATCNGGPTAIYIANYCGGMGVAGNLVIGLLSHLQGPAGPHPPDATNDYVVGIKCCANGNPPCTGCTGRFAALLGGLPTPDPFTVSLPPEPTKYCR
jgi:hypothetical protein